MNEKSTDFAAASGVGYDLQMGRFSGLLAPDCLEFSKRDDRLACLDASHDGQWHPIVMALSNERTL